jgi:hypothetical protein
MSPAGAADVHVPYVKSLVETGDWAGLARYWLAHQYPPALERALEVVQRRAARQAGPWPALA